MQIIKEPNLAQLLMQLRFAPERERKKQVDAAERLLGLINSEREYPFEFVCFHITDYRPKSANAQELIKGDALLRDLPIFIARLSGQVSFKTEEIEEKIYSIEKLAKRFSVSTKTIDRWRKRGLVGRRFVFADGNKRLGFGESVVEKFAADNPELVRKASEFVRLPAAERKEIVDKTLEFCRAGGLGRQQVIGKVAECCEKAPETVRYTIRRYEKLHPGKTIFERTSGVVKAADAGRLYEMFKKGVAIEKLMKEFGRSKSSVYRIINGRKASELLAQKIEFIASEEFLEEGVSEGILDAQISQAGSRRKDAFEKLGEVKDSMPQYLEAISRAALFNRRREMELFRKYNYLKYLASIRRAKIKVAGVTGGQVKEIEKYLAQVEEVKRAIIEANLRLVVSIAGKHTQSGANLQDLISVGNLALMRAVEKFDYTRGFRFSTYASWAIAKAFAKEIPAETSRLDKAEQTDFANIQRDFRTADIAGVLEIENAHRSLEQVIKDNLDEREEYIIINHFGLTGSLIRKNFKTLKQIGAELDLSKERVRQIELVALQKLRHSLSIEEFEHLTS